MRYEIKAGKIVESFWIDAPYDTKEDALEALETGVIEYTAKMESPVTADRRYCYECNQWEEK
jgi:hypothetical protein